MSNIDSENEEVHPDRSLPDISKLSITDLFGSKHWNKSICKFIDVVSSHVGIRHEPTRIINTAKAEAKAAIIRAKADAKIKKIEKRANNRLLNKELRRQKNIESVVKGAAHLLPEQVFDEKPNEDWIYEFFNSCQDIGDNEMHILWSKILASEVSKPGTYSIRTLNLLKTMTKEDANLFTNVCSAAWQTGNNDYVSIYTSVTDKYMAAKHITYPHLLHLQSIGLIEMEPSLGYPFESGPLSFSYFGTSYRIF